MTNVTAKNIENDGLFVAANELIVNGEITMKSLVEVGLTVSEIDDATMRQMDHGDINWNEETQGFGMSSSCNFQIFSSAPEK